MRIYGVGTLTMLKRWLLVVVTLFVLAIPLGAFGVESTLQGEPALQGGSTQQGAPALQAEPTPQGTATLQENDLTPNTFIALGEPGAPSGTPDDPFLISTEEDLAAFATSVNGKRVTNGVWEDAQSGAHDYAGLTVQLAQDITLTSSFTPIGIGMNISGSVATPICFSGIFDGQGHTISGLYFTKASNPLINSNYHGAQWFSALFGAVKDANVINLVVQLSPKATFSVNTLSSEASAGLIAQVVGGDTIVTCCGVVGDLSGTSSHLGGIVGRVEGGTLDMSYCYHQGKLVTASSGGGLVNCSSATVKLTSCYQAGQVSSTNTSTYASRFFGQLVGTGSGYTLAGCVASSTDDLAGGNAKNKQTGCLSGIEVWNTTAVQGALGTQYFGYGEAPTTFPELVAKAQPSYVVSFSVGSDVAGARPSSFKAAPGTSITIPTSTLTRKGYVFSGWRISGAPGETGSSGEAPAPGETDATLYNAGDTLSMPRGNLSFEAAWTLVEAVEISTEAELRTFAEGVNADTIKTDNLRYVLTCDIQLTSPWTPIGNDKHPFEGIFDGQGHVVSGMQVTNDSLSSSDSSTASTYAGFFGYVSGADITSLGVEGTIDADSATCTGGLVGSTTGSAATSNKPEDMTHVSACYANVTINAGGFAAGLAGRSTRTSFEDCYAAGSVRLVSGGKAVGGLVGYYQSASFSDTSAPAIQRCFSVSTVASAEEGACAGNLFGKVSEYYAKCDKAASWSRAMEVYALASDLCAYYTESNNGDTSKLATEFEPLYEKSSADMKADTFLQAMGSAFVADSSDEKLQKNNGFPILAWQQVLVAPISISTTPFATAGGEALYLVTYTGDVAEGKMPTIKGEACYWNGSAYVTLMTRSEAGALVYADVAQVEGSAPQATSSDVNGDGSLSIIDAQIAYDLGAGRYNGFDKLDCGAWLRADANGDGVLDAADAWAIQHAIHEGFDV